MGRSIEEKVQSLIDEDELVALTQKLVRIATPNPPVDYSVIAPEMKRLMEDVGLQVKVMEGAPGKPNVVGLWRGTDPNSPTLLLDAHGRCSRGRGLACGSLGGNRSRWRHLGTRDC